MKCRKLSIHNFRGIRHAEVAVGDYSLLVGANGAGKSTVIDAIRIFYEKDGYKFKPNSDKPFSIPDGEEWESWIEITYELTDEEIETLAEKYRRDDKLLNLRKYLVTKEKGDDAKTKQGLICAVKPDGEVFGESFYGAKNVQDGKLGEVIYIPAISNVDDHTKLTGPSVLRELLNDLVGGAVAVTDAYTELEAAVGSFSEKIREHEGAGISLSSVESALNDELDNWGVQFSLKFSPPAATEIVKSLVDWSLTGGDHGKELPPEGFGTGFQRHFIFSLILTAARFGSKATKPKKEDFSPSMTLLLFEEPEAFLHPPQQDQLARALQREASDGRWQVIASTHSAHFVSRNAGDLVSMIRACRHGNESNLYQISKSQWDDLTDRNKAIAEIAKKYPKLQKRLQEADLEPEMDSLRFFLWLNPDRSGAFFADCAVLVEGPTEVALLNQLFDSGEINLGSGVHVIDSIGKYNTHRFMNLFGLLGVTHAVIVDDDNDKDEHVELNELIRSSSNEFTRGIEFIPGELETLLGLPPARSDHRKPQHVLYCRANGQCDEAGLKQFISLAEEVVGQSKMPTGPSIASQNAQSASPVALGNTK